MVWISIILFYVEYIVATHKQLFELVFLFALNYLFDLGQQYVHCSIQTG